MKTVLKQIITEAKKELSIEEEIKLSVKPMQKKIASISLNKKVLSVNKEMLKILSHEEIRFVIYHELLHLKHGKYHTVSFKKELSKYFSIEEEKKLYRKLSRYLNLSQ